MIESAAAVLAGRAENIEISARRILESQDPPDTSIETVLGMVADLAKYVREFADNVANQWKR